MLTTLGNVFDIGSGGTPSKKHTEYYDGDIPWVKTGDLKDKDLYVVEDYITEKGLKNSSAKMYEPGTVLIAMYGATIGAVSILRINACTNQACAAFKPCKAISPEYLYYFLRSKKQSFIKDGVGGAQPNISAGYLKKVEIDLRPLDEQNETVTRLNLLDSIIHKRQQEIKNLDNLVKARFVEMFGEGLIDDGKYPLIPISEIGEVVSGATPKTSINEYWDGTNLWITPAEISDNSFVVSDTVRKITAEGVRSCAVNLLPIGTVILSSRAPIGKVAIAGAPMYCNQGFKNIIPNEKIDSIYLYELLAMETEYLNSLGRGATFKEISKQIVENIKIKVPPIEVQRQFSGFVKQVNTSKVVIQKALDATQLLFNSLMQLYFGER